MRLARKERRYITPCYGPAVVDRERASDTLALAERTLRNGDARLAEETYQRVLGKLGPFADPIWCTDEATDARTRSQCHARLAALAFDDGDYDRSLRQTALAAADRHHAIEVDQCSGDDIRFLITAMVHSATVHERVGARREAMEASAVALEFARFSRTQTHDDHTRRSIAAAQRAAACLFEELRGRIAGEDLESVDADARSRVRPSVGADWLDAVLKSEDAIIDLTDDAARRDLLATASIDVLGIPDEPVKPGRLRPHPSDVEESFTDLVPEVIDLTDQPDPVDEHDTVAASIDRPVPDPVDPSDLIDLTDRVEPPPAFAPLVTQAPADTRVPNGSLEPAMAESTRPAGPVDLLDEVADAATRHPAATAPPAPAPTLPELEQPVSDPAAPATVEPDDEPADDRFTRPDRRAERQAAAATKAKNRRSPTPILIPADRRQDQPVPGDSAAQLVGRSRGQSLLARVLLGHSDSEAAINAHRAVRTATRARQWAKEDSDALPVVALNLIEALVVRADVLVSTGHDEVARTDLRRARAIAEQLWRACPSAIHAVAVVLVEVRSAALDTTGGHEERAEEQLDLARAVLDEWRALEVALPKVLRQAEVTLTEDLIGTGELDVDDNHGLSELGDRLLDHLQARDQDPAELESLAPTVAAG